MKIVRVGGLMAALAAAGTTGAAVLAGCAGGGTGGSVSGAGGQAQSRIVFASDRAAPGQGHNIYTVLPDGSGLKQLTALSLPNEAAEPALSPDRTKVAFSAFTGTPTAQLMVMNVDGSDAHQLTIVSQVTSARVPTWSPDGHQIAFATGVDGTAGIMVVNSDGSNLRRLTNVGSNPSWSLQNKIAYDAASAGNGASRIGDAHIVSFLGPTSIFIMNSDGTGRVRLPGFGGEPSWRPDAGKLLYIVNVTNQSETIYTANADGSGPTSIVTQAEQAKFSPDGQHVIYQTPLLGQGTGPRHLVVQSLLDGSLTNLTLAVAGSLTGDVDPDWR